MRALASILVLCILLIPHAATRALTIDDVIGTWMGEAQHAGDTSPVAVVFERMPNGAVRTVVSLPGIHARMGIGAARIAGGRVEVGSGPLVFEYDPATRTLATTLPPELVPKYQLHVKLRRSSAIDPPKPREPDAPIRQPIWSTDLGAPIWADTAFGDGLAIVGADDGRLHGVDGRTGRIVWSIETGGAIRARPTFVGGDIVVQSDSGWLHRVNAKTGAQRWRVRIATAPATRVDLGDPKSRYENRASAAAADRDRLFVGTHEGRLLALRASDGAELWSMKAGDSITATPVVAGGVVYCGSFDHQLYAVSASTGAVLWQHDTGDAVTTAAAVVGRRVIVGSRSYDLEALDAQSGAAAWTKYVWFSWVESPPAIFGDRLYVGSSDAAKVFAIDPATGRSTWEGDAGGSAWGQPAVTDAAVYEGVGGVAGYIAPHRGSVMAFDRPTGAVRWWYPAPAPTAAAGALTAYGFPGVGGGRTESRVCRIGRRPALRVRAVIDTHPLQRFG